MKKKPSPEKVRAYRAVQYALSTGKLIKEACAVCGDPNSQAHHEDYSEPLVVTWLCSSHHTAHHSASRPVRMRDAVNMRVPRGLWDRLKQHADKECRSAASLAHYCLLIGVDGYLAKQKSKR